MKILVLILSLTLFLSSPAIGQAPTVERLFCGSCGELNRMTANYCGACGERLDKQALTRRLQTRLAEAERDSLSITLMPDEVRVLARIEAEQYAHTVERKPSKSPARPQSEIDQVLNLVAPVAIGVGAIYFTKMIVTTVLK